MSAQAGNSNSAAWSTAADHGSQAGSVSRYVSNVFFLVLLQRGVACRISFPSPGRQEAELATWYLLQEEALFEMNRVSADHQHRVCYLYSLCCA